MEERLKESFINLKNRIWKTYKSRINSAERLEKNNNFVAFLSIYYSAVLAAVSILNYVNKNSNMDVCNIVLSVMVTILFLYFDGRNFKERYINMKKNYNELNLLYYKVESDIEINNINQEHFEELTQKYTDLLGNVENHSKKDYIKYALNDKEIQIGCIDKVMYYLGEIGVFLLKGFVFMIPTTFLAISFIELFL